jgi:hypothetical protein
VSWPPVAALHRVSGAGPTFSTSKHRSAPDLFRRAELTAFEHVFEDRGVTAAVVGAPARQAGAVRRAGERPVPVLPALEPLLPAGGLRRGSAVAVRGSTALLLALLAGPSREGAWCAVVGLPGLGLVAAAETGVALERLALVPDPGPDWAAVAGALLDAMDVVVVAPRGRVLDGEVRRLAARARQRGAVLVPYGAVRWPGVERRLSVVAGSWEGLDQGCGHLRARRVVVRGEGRGAAARARELRLWLPAPEGGVRADPTPLLRAVPDLPPAPPAPAAPAPPTPSPVPPAGRVAERAAGRGRALHAVPVGGAGPGPGPGSAGPGPARSTRPARGGRSRPRPGGVPVPPGRSAAVGGGGLPVPPPPVGAPPTAGPGGRVGAAGARPGIPAEVLARLRPASTLPRPARRAVPG